MLPKTAVVIHSRGYAYLEDYSGRHIAKVKNEDLPELLRILKIKVREEKYLGERRGGMEKREERIL